MPRRECIDQRVGLWCFVTTCCLVAVLLYGIQYAMEGIKLSSEVEVVCKVFGFETVNSLCFEQECDSGSRDCFTVSRTCYKLRYDVTFDTPNGLAVLAVTTKSGDWPSYATAHAAGTAAVDTSKDCFYTPGDPEFLVSVTPTPMESSYIPVILFGVLGFASAGCGVCWARRARRERQDDDDDEVATTNFV